MKHLILIVLSGFCMVQCTREEIDSRSYPRVSTYPVTGIASSGATFHAEVIYSNAPITDHGFVWSMNEIPTIENADSVSMGSMPSRSGFSATVNRSLLPGMKYYVRGYARADNYLVYGDIVSFISSGSELANSIVNIVPSQHLMPRNKITVLGNFEGPLQVKINGEVINPLMVTDAGKGKFTVQLPDLLKPLNDLSIVISGKEIKARKQLSVALTRIAKAHPMQINYQSICATGNKNYLGIGSDSLFVYNIRSNQFSFIGKEVIPLRRSVFSFAFNGTGYFGGGTDNNNVTLTDFYSIDTATNVVTRLADLDDNRTVAAFKINNKGYRLNTVTSPVIKHELFEFDPVSKSWAKKTGLPVEVSPNPVSFESNGIGYIIRLINAGWDGEFFAGTIELWAYDPGTDKWKKMPDTGIRADFKFGTVTAGGKVYLVRTLTDEGSVTWSDAFHEFDPSTGKFLNYSFSSHTPFQVTGTFSNGSAGYILSYSYIWKFDPAF